MKNKPTTGDMMIAFVECYIPGSDVREMSALFDEWIAGVQAKAWDEGHDAGWNSRDDDAARGWIPSGVHESDAENPYRKAVE